jgi:O-antigen/teichoic acid export membrane protein
MKKLVIELVSMPHKPALTVDSRDLVSQPSERSHGRYRRILEASVSAILSKGITLLVSLATVPIAVRYLGPELYGIWITLSTTITLLVVLDLGIANTLTNLISEAYAADDSQRAARYATTAFWIVVLVASVLALVGLLIWPHVDWGAIFNVRNPALRESISKSVLIAYIIFLISLPAGLAGKMLGGYQEVRTANLFTAAGSVLSLIFVIAIVRLHGSLQLLVLSYSGSIVGTNLLCLLWLWAHHKPWLAPWRGKIDRTVVRRLMRTGGEFFIIQLAGLVVFNSDNLVITHYLGPAAVTPYNVTWRLASYAAALQTVTTPALWPAYAEAFARDDWGWIKKTFRRTMLGTMTIAAFLSLGVVLWGRTIISHWAGTAAVPTESLIIVMCIWVMISTYMNNTACVMVAINETRIQAWASALSAVVNLAATVWLVQRVGLVGVILGTVGSYLLVLVAPQTWQVYHRLYKRSDK